MQYNLAPMPAYMPMQLFGPRQRIQHASRAHSHATLWLAGAQVGICLQESVAAGGGSQTKVICLDSRIQKLALGMQGQHSARPCSIS